MWSHPAPAARLGMLAAFVVMACGSATEVRLGDHRVVADYGSSVCVPGMSAVCRCAGGAMGAQTCRADGDFDPCVCLAREADAGSDGATTTSRIVEVALGESMSCARYGDGRVVCWGRNGEDGQLGIGDTADHPTPTPVMGLTDAAGLSVNGEMYASGHSCAWRRDGTLSCWGRGYSGELGFSAYRGYPVPHTVPDRSAIAGAVVVPLGTCAWTARGEAWCWGALASVPGPPIPVSAGYVHRAVRGLPPIRQLAGVGQTMCARIDGGVLCWGYGGTPSVLLGDGVPVHAGCSDPTWRVDCTETPVTVAGVSDAVDLVCGSVGLNPVGHFCVRRAGGTVACWGQNSDGELGDGTTTGRGTPVEVVGLTDVAQVAAAMWNTCALRNDGTVWCWGGNAFGQLGDGMADHGHTCRESPILRTTGTADCSPTPVQVAGLGDAVSVGVGREHACAVRRSGAVVCWGRNLAGQLGDGSTLDSNRPVSVVGL